MAKSGGPEEEKTSAPKRRMKGPEREQMILAEAIRFFAEHGFEGQTRELAKRVGVAHSALYRHFPSKEALIERVYEHVYVSRWNPAWRALATDRTQPIETRLVGFYLEYIERIFSYEWVRIFVYSGLRGFNIAGRYLDIVRREFVLPICQEMRADPDDPRPISEREEEAVWGLHGQIFYLAIRRFVYGSPTPADLEPIVRDHVARFVRGHMALDRCGPT